jgi:hypothetical protein
LVRCRADDRAIFERLSRGLDSPVRGSRRRLEQRESGLVADPEDVVFVRVEKREHMVGFELLPHWKRNDAAAAQDAHQPEPRADP